MVNRAIQDRQALRGGDFPLRLPDADIWLVDMDGTMCNHEDENGEELRSPYDMTKVLLDREWKEITDMIRAAYSTTNIFVLSGRDDVAGEDSEAWLEGYKVPFDRLIMRDVKGVPDTVIKQGMLDELLTLFPKHRITRVVDDRPKVCKMWLANGLTVYPVFKGVKVENFTTVHKDTCGFDQKKGYRRCPQCFAMEEF
jgi:hypothetical protein